MLAKLGLPLQALIGLGVLCVLWMKAHEKLPLCSGGGALSLFSPDGGKFLVFSVNSDFRSKFVSSTVMIDNG